MGNDWFELLIQGTDRLVHRPCFILVPLNSLILFQTDGNKMLPSLSKQKFGSGLSSFSFFFFHWLKGKEGHKDISDVLGIDLCNCRTSRPTKSRLISEVWSLCSYQFFLSGKKKKKDFRSRLICKRWNSISEFGQKLGLTRLSKNTVGV